MSQNGHLMTANWPKLETQTKHHQHEAGGACKPAGAKARRCRGNLKKLMRKVGITFTFPTHVIPKNQTLSF
jgi:hypothetical protein